MAMISRRDFLASSSAIALLAISGSADGSIHGSSGTSPVVINLGGGSVDTTQTAAFTNIAKTWNPAVPSVSGWPSMLAGANNYPSGNFATRGSGGVYYDQNYYGRYLLSWSVSGGPGTCGVGNFGSNSTALLIFARDGTTVTFGESPAAGGESGGGLFFQTGTTGTSVEIGYGFMIGAVGTDASTGSTLVKFTTQNVNRAFNLEGAKMKFFNLSGLPNNPASPDGAWTIKLLDNSNFVLLGSSAYAGSVSGIITTGGPSLQTHCIYSIAVDNLNLFGDFTGANFSNLVLCKKADLADVQAGKLASQGLVDAFKGTKGSYIRFMDILRVQAVQAPPWAQRVTPSSFTWGEGYTPIGCWAGVLTNSADTFTAPINPANSPASGAYVDGEVIVAQVGPTAHNTTQNPKLGITGRSAAAPIYSQVGGLLALTLGGAVPATGKTISLTFTGAGMNGLLYQYVTTAGDTSFGTIAANIRNDLQNNPLSKASVTSFLAAGAYCDNADANAFPGPQMAFQYRANLDASGNPVRGNRLSITGSDTDAVMTFTFGYIPTSNATLTAFVDNGMMSFTYSKLLEAWIGTVGQNVGVGGLRGTPPLEFCTELCARTGIGMWFNIGVLDTAALITSQVQFLAQAQYNGQPAVKSLALEWGNETWNLGTQAGITKLISAALGFTVNGGGAYSAHGLRTRQMAELAVAAWTGAGRARSDLRIVNAYQFPEPIPNPLTSATNSYRFGGSALNASNTGTNVSLKNFGALGGTAPPLTDYSVAPNRPIDWCDWMSPAPYVQGGQMCAAFGAFNYGPVSNLQDVLLAAYNYAYGNPTQQTAALDFLYNIGTASGDMYKGTLHDGTNPQGHQLAGWLSVGSGNAYAGYAGVATIAASYDAARVTNGSNSGGALLKLGVGCYEGGWFMAPTFPTQLINSLNAQGYTNGYSSGLPGAAALPAGVTDTSTTAAANLYKFLVAWKNDPRCTAWTTRVLGDFRAAVIANGARENYFAWYGWEGGNEYALYPGLVTGLAPYKAYDAIAAFR